MAQLQVSFRLITLPIEALVQMIGATPIEGFQLIGAFYHPDPVYPDSTVMYHGVRNLLAVNGMTSMQQVKIIFDETAIGTPRPPFNLTLPFIAGPEPVRVGADLTGNVGGWLYEPDSYAVGWYRDGGLISGAENNNYTVTEADIGAVITFRVTAMNVVGASTQAISLGTNPVKPKAIPDTRARYGLGDATAGSLNASSAATLLARMKVMNGGTNGTRNGAFTIDPSAREYGWAAFEASASAAPTGVTFTDFMGTGGWQGAEWPTQNVEDDNEDERNTSTVVHEINGVLWRFFRQSYMGAKGVFTTS